MRYEKKKKSIIMYKRITLLNDDSKQYWNVAHRKYADWSTSGSKEKLSNGNQFINKLMERK